VAPCAGPAFAFQHEKIAELNSLVEEMDKLEVIEINASSFDYQDEIIAVFRSIADPFDNQLKEVSYEPNPNDMA